MWRWADTKLFEKGGHRMSHLGVVEDTLFVPMLGRIYASEHCPQIIYDKKALELKEKLPSDLQETAVRASIPCWLQRCGLLIWTVSSGRF